MRRGLALCGLTLGYPWVGPAYAGEAPSWRYGDELNSGLTSRPGRPFEALVHDMDGDGDPDLIVNRHLGGLLLFQGVEGRFQLSNGAGGDPTGLQVPPGVRTTFGAAGLAARVEGPSVLAWQPRFPFGLLDLRVRRDGEGPRWLRIHTHGSLTVVEADARVVVEDESRVRVRLPRRGVVAVRVEVGTHTPWWRLDQLDGPDRPAAAPLPFLVGEDMVAFQGDSLQWWSQDPHGLAWAQVGEGPEPELVVVRGGNIGRLQDEGLIKEHGFHAWTGAADGWFRDVPGALPADSGRGRGAAWVDLDADGLPELSLTNRDGANALLVWTPARSGALVEGAFEDRAAALGLADVCSEAVAFLDLDEDGWDDQVALCFDKPQRGGFEVRRALGVGAFLPAAPEEVGLPAEGLPVTRKGWLREEHMLVHDLDGDGHLDLVAVSLGDEHQLAAFCGDGAGRLDPCDERLGLAELSGVLAVRAADLDLDGWLDLLLEGEAPRVAMGSREGFAVSPVRVDGLEAVGRAALVPIEGAVDAPPALLVLAPERWTHAEAVTPAAGRRLTVRFDAGEGALPPGAVLLAEWADGHRQALRLGSAGATALSQVVGPLSLGVPTGQAPPRLSVRWPGRPELVDVPVPPDADAVTIAVPAP